jgi:glutamate dehydrogenase
MGRHRLRRQIAAMLIASSMINRMGPSFMIRAQEDTGADTAEVTSAYAIVRNLFSTRRLWRDIEALDGRVQAAVQYDSFFEASRMVRRAVYWFLHRFPHGLDIADTIERFGPTVTEVLEVLPRVLAGVARRRFERDTREFESLGVPSALGQRVATLRLMTQVLDIAALSLEHAAEPAAVAKLHFEVGRGLRLDWLRDQIEELDVEGHWRAMARGTLRETLGQEQRAILGRILRRAAGGQLDVALADWLTRRNAQIVRMKQTFEEMQSTGQMDFATLSIALKELSRLTNGAKLG